MYEYRVCWSASSNISFRGEGEWEPWDEGDWSESDIEAALYASEAGSVALPIGLDIALEKSGFEWWVETRESA